MPSVADYLQRSIAVGCIALSIWGASAGISGHNKRMARAREAAASMTVDPADLTNIPSKPIGTMANPEIQKGNPT
ncbi:hypothetical protein NliqN6_3538 [Naganishia liquefaciens]|uniref:Uncharacterized protein n=1 Tax=Naganishia liquefaciens TaxID=104408 RepID=A0A8H3TTC3_9TREE|nr:hypothetical protein NliqN6_3538 [Naganishia liquefaciens]